MKSYFYGLLRKYLSVYVRPGDSVVTVNPPGNTLSMPEGVSADTLRIADGAKDDAPAAKEGEHAPDYVLLDGSLHYARDIHTLLRRVHALCSPETRLIITYYSSFWKPLVMLATRLGMREKTLEENWIAHEDIVNFLEWADFELVSTESRIIVPVWIPLFSNLINRFLAPLPVFRLLCMVNIGIARPRIRREGILPSLSVVVPVRNEAGNIEPLVRRLPAFPCPFELIFVEGNSRDDSWERVLDIRRRYGAQFPVKALKQDGKGKGDAVRKGFAAATGDLLVILDADISVPPESLLLFYRAFVEGKGEFINGSRLVYPMSKNAMKFCNLMANKFFATAFSYVLGQRFKDTLCGTKAISRSLYAKIAAHRSYFGDFDPFGDFDLIFGAARLGLKIFEVPIRYDERIYGSTNIRRWRHGMLLFSMLFYAAKKIKFI